MRATGAFHTCTYMDQQRIFDELDETFSHQCESLQSRLEKILQDILAGSIPDEQEEHEVYKSLHLLRKTRDQYFEETRKILGDEHTPTQGAPLDEYRSALIHHWNAEHKSKLRSVLEQFTRVTSPTARYADLLAPLIDSAHESIALLEKSETHAEDVAKAAVGPRLFLRALQMDPRSPEGAAFIEEELSAHYSSDVRIGFFVGAYTAPQPADLLPEGQDASAEASSSRAGVPCTDQTGAGASQALTGTDAPQQAPADSAASGDSIQDTASTEHHPQAAQTDRPQASPERAAARAAAMSSPGAQPALRKAPAVPVLSLPMKESGEIIRAVNKPRVGAKAAVFKRDFLSIAHEFRELPALMTLMAATGPAAADAISTIGECAGVIRNGSYRRTTGMLEALARKGLAAEFECEVGGETVPVYGLSSFAAESMRKESVAKLFRGMGCLPIRTAGGFGPQADGDRVAASANDADALAYLLDTCSEEFYDSAFRRDMPAVSWSTVAGRFSCCRVTLPYGPSRHQFDAQLVHHASDPDLIIENNILYVQQPGYDPPDDLWKKRTRGYFITYYEGDLTFEPGQWEERIADSAEEAEKSSPPADAAADAPAAQARPAADMPAAPDGTAAAGGLPPVHDEPGLAEPGSSAEAPCGADVQAAIQKPESGRKPAAEDTSLTGAADPAAGSQESAAASEPELLSGARRAPVQFPLSVPARPLPTSWKKPDATREELAAAVRSSASYRKSVSGALSAVHELTAAEERGRTSFAAVLGAAECGPVPDDSTIAEAAMAIAHSAVMPSAEAEVPANAVLMAKSGAMIPGYVQCESLSRQLQLATGILVDSLSYSSVGLEAAFPDPSAADASLVYSAYARALLAPSSPGDYLLKARARDLFSRYEEVFPKLPEFKGLLKALLDAWETGTTGFPPSVIALLGSNADSEAYMKKLAGDARELMRVATPTTQLKPLAQTHKAAFGQGSDLYNCMDIICRDARQKRKQVERTLRAFCDPARPDAFVLDENRIEQDLDRKWGDVVTSKGSKSSPLGYAARDREIRGYRQRLELMVDWVTLLQAQESNSKELRTLKTVRDKVIRALDQVERKAGWQKQPGADILRHLLSTVRRYLENRGSEGRSFAAVLKTGRFWLDDLGRPVFHPQLANVPFFESWRQAALHLKAMEAHPERTYEDVRAEILGEGVMDSSGLMDNLYQLESIQRILGSDAPSADVSEELRGATRDAAAESRREFEQELDVAYMKGLVNLEGKSRILKTLNEFEPLFFEKEDFAVWRWFLGALSQQIGASADKRIESCMARLNEIREGSGDAPLLQIAEQELTEERNFTVAEECLNHYESGDLDWRPTDGASSGSGMYFDDFRSTDVFRPLLEECRRNGEGRGTSTLRSFGTQYVQKHRPNDWTSRHSADSTQFLKAWPTGKGTSPEQVQSFLTSLGIDAAEVVLKRQKGNVEVFEAAVNAVPSGKKDYAHPIAAFGTRMEPALRVVAVYGKCLPEQLVDTMRELDYDDISLVLLDYHMDLGQRRQLAEIFHRQTGGQNRFLVVDRVLALYMALLTGTERLKAMLQCTLPYTSCQPFGSDGGSTPDEMFCGREEELKKILDPNGPSIVYGGRQLGKTALLQRAQSRFHSPEKRRYAAYANIQACDSEEKLTHKLVQNIQTETGGALDLADTGSLEELCAQLEQAFREKRITSLLLLMDEADMFLKSIDEDMYAQLQPLVELRQATRGRFKFVLAGLHNVCRAEHAMVNNGVLGQLGTPLVIRPLTSAEASRLLRRPLRYLGFDIPARQLETLITNSNFYPGVLQFIGYMLVETLPEHYRKSYYSAVANPPFGLDDTLLGTVLNSRDLNASIRSKVRATLELDERYFMIARAIALVSYLDEDAQAKGCTAQEIAELADSYDTACLAEESDQSISALLDEMVEMGLLVSTDSGQHYRFRRDSFKDIVGTDADMLEAALSGKGGTGA